MPDYRETLKQYWGYHSFRPLQEDIIRSVMAGNDTLGLMPTGGGKSLTFQVPAMTMPGICLVVTPLIALMRDQVDTLRKLGIKAVAIHSACTRDEIEVALNNCLYGGYKFLYVSPERLRSDLFRLRFGEMPVNLIAVDEAHCISQWGYDFRPSYLAIAEMRSYHPAVPILALTATATQPVVQDIQDKLRFRSRNVLQMSFLRENLVFAVRYSENKDSEVIDMTRKLRGTGIIYVRNRRKCMEISRTLNNQSISAAPYHAGMEPHQRNEVQTNWTAGKTRVIVATNAFGMGIDKSDVRFVIHFDLPDSPESYYQEAGRAGRDGKKAFAILLSSPSDQLSVNQRIAITFPEIAHIKHTYAALCNYLQLAVGSGKGMAYDFNLNDFATTFKLQATTSFNSLKILELEGYLSLTEEMNNPSRIRFLLNRDDLYKFQVANSRFDDFIKMLLRSYTGIFTEYTAIDEHLLAKRAGVDPEIVEQYLNRLSQASVISYIPRRRSPMIVFLEERLEEKSLYISKETYANRRERFTARANAMLQYARESDRCRRQRLLEYFGEQGTEPCGECDICRNSKATYLGREEFEMISEELTGVLALQPLSIDDLLLRVAIEKSKALEAIRWLMDNDHIQFNNEQKLILRHKWHPPS